MIKCIYKITNLENGLVYIGKTNNFKRRLKEYKQHSSKITKRRKYKIMEEINKYGFSNFVFDIVEEITDVDYLNEREIFWISYYDSTNPEFGYNSKSGGVGGSMNDESKIKMSNSSKGFKHTEEEKLKRSKAITTFSDGIVTHYSSAKEFAKVLNKDRSEITAAIKRGVFIKNHYVFYSDYADRISVVNNIIDEKSNKNSTSRFSLSLYLLAYELTFPNDKSVETIESVL